MNIAPPLLLAAALALAAPAADFARETLDSADAAFGAATNATMYAEAARQYGRIINEEGLHNAALHLRAGNSWFMADDIGRAILHYRRAARQAPRDPDIRHNLKAARAARIDLIPERPPHPLAARLLGWHLGTSPAARGWCFAACWLLFWGAWFWARRHGRKEARLTAYAAGVLAALLLASLATDAIRRRLAQPGVIVAKETLARKGDGQMYAPAFIDPLHAGTEFVRLEARGEWWRVRLADGQTCWIHATAAEMVDSPPPRATAP